ncbi:hypothetical protein VULLAG_LOCUS21826 [Vulpes lagopus]
MHTARPPQLAAHGLAPFLTHLQNLSSIFYPEPTLFLPQLQLCCTQSPSRPCPHSAGLEPRGLTTTFHMTKVLASPSPCHSAPRRCTRCGCGGQDGHPLPVVALAPFVRGNMLLSKCSKLPLTSSRPPRC